MCERLVDFEYHCRINNMFRPLVGELLMSTPKVFYREPRGWSGCRENSLPNPHLLGEERAAAQCWSWGEGWNYAFFYFVWCMASPNPGTLSWVQTSSFASQDRGLLPSGMELRRGPGVWGDNWFFNNFHAVLLILVPLPHSFLPSSRGN